MTTEPLVACLLAGGLATRMGGGDKGLRPFAGATLLARAIARLRPQAAELILNANGDPTRFAPFGLPVVADGAPGHPGPLAGVLAALDWIAAHRPEVRFALTAPIDAPFLPRDLAARLLAARAAAGARLAVAVSAGQAHPVVGLWEVALREDLRAALLEEGVRRIDRWTGRHGVAQAIFAVDPVDPFLNVNTPEDLAAAELIAARLPDA